MARQQSQKLLLTGIFGPFGIKDDFAEGTGMQMELLNNQVTRGQNIHSIRQHYWTLPLYLLAENISVPSVVLDFPKWEDFKEELKNNYTHVGINFIVPNVMKVKRMTEYIREHYPEIKIILGGFGTIIPNLDKILSYDEICKGEGVAWIRDYFKEDSLAPMKHPIVKNPIHQSIYGFKSEPIGSVIMPGVGCKNGCEFCITSHKFGKKYIPLMKDGKEIFEHCEKSHQLLGANEFFVMDENFLMQPERARELLIEMEKNKRPFYFDIFSSAEVVKQMGIDFLVRMGVKMVWIGVESKFNTHAKTKDIDMKGLITELQSHGITVNASAILFLDHHTEETIQEDIDWVISLGADMSQFMNYTAYPTTALYQRLDKEGKIKDLDYRYQTGALELNWVHPHITDPTRHFDILKKAFQKKYETDGPAILGMAITAIKGYTKAISDYKERKKNNLRWDHESLSYIPCKQGESPIDEFWEMRIEKLLEIVNIIKPTLLSCKVYSPNDAARNKVKYAEKLFKDALGKPSIKDNTMSIGLLGLASRAKLEHSIAAMRGEETIILQPPTNRVEYRIDEKSMNTVLVQKEERKDDISSLFTGGLKGFFKVIDHKIMDLANYLYN